MLNLLGPFRTLVINRLFMLVERSFQFAFPGSSKLKLGLNLGAAIVERAKFLGPVQQERSQRRDLFACRVQLRDGGRGRFGV